MDGLRDESVDPIALRSGLPMKSESSAEEIEVPVSHHSIAAFGAIGAGLMSS